MKVVVIGGAGFVGRHVAFALHKEGADVAVCDMNIEKPLDGEGPPLVFKCDVLDLDGLRWCMNDADVVMHLAAISNTQAVLSDVPLAVNVTCLGTANVLKVACELKVKRVVIASSSLISGMLEPMEMSWPEDCYEWYEDEYDVYGKCTHMRRDLLPHLEQFVTDELSLIDVTKPLHPYVTTKLFQEMLARDYARTKDLPVTILRYGIMYGEAMTPGVVVDTFIRQALYNEPLILHGDGQQWRQYLHVSDVAQAHVDVLKHWNASHNQTFNLTPMYKTTIAELANAVCEQIPGTKVEYGDARAADVPMRFCLADRAKNKLGWSPRIGLEEGMARTVDWYRDKLRRW